MTNAQSKHQDANAKTILKNAVLNLHEFCEKNYKFNIETSFKNQTKDDKVVLVDNNTYYLLIQHGKERHSIRGSDGTKRIYIYDEKDGIYKTKFKTHIIAPHFHLPYEMWKCGFKINWRNYWEKYSADGVFDEQSSRIRKKLHTGNHYRNNFVSVPKSVYG